MARPNETGALFGARRARPWWPERSPSANTKLFMVDATTTPIAE
jgi:hypothetical protein